MSFPQSQCLQLVSIEGDFVGGGWAQAYSRCGREGRGALSFQLSMAVATLSTPLAEILDTPLLSCTWTCIMKLSNIGTLYSTCGCNNHQNTAYDSVVSGCYGLI